jgi:hypothetical protein
VRIEQALHGYADGHRLLACSPGVSAAARRQLDRRSDLSGPLPLGHRMAALWTGYPVDGAWAFAATWPDPDAPRGGAVLTHTLLVPPGALAGRSLEALARLHRRPAPGERAPYAEPLPLPPEDGAPDGPPPLDPALLAAVFGPGPRPALRLGREGAEAEAAAIWARLWPEARARFAFCTAAYGPVDLPDRPFDLLWVPVEARGGFSVRGRSGWIGPEAPPWAAALDADGGPAARVAQARALGLPAPPAEQAGVLARWLELQPQAPRLLAAARGCADLLDRLCPDPLQAPLAWIEALQALISTQPQALTAPRPWWELNDLLSRPQWAALGMEGSDPRAPAAAAGLRPGLERALDGAFAERLPLAPPPPELGPRLAALGLEGAARAGAARAAGGADPAADAKLLAHALEAGVEGLPAAVLGAWPSPRRHAAAGAQLLHPALAAAARAAGDLGLWARARWAVGEGALAALLAEGAALDAALLTEVPDPELLEALDPAAPPALWVEALQRGPARQPAALERLGRAPPALLQGLLRGHGPELRAALAGWADAGLPEALLRSLSPRDRLALATPPTPPKGATWVFAEAWVEALLEAEGPPPDPRWLDGPLGAELERLGEGMVRRLAGGAEALGAALPSILARLGPAAARHRSLWRPALGAAQGPALARAAGALLALRPWSVEESALVLDAARRSPASAGPALVASAFPPVHQQLMGKDALSLLTAPWWGLFGWDRAGAWRKWLAHTWAEQGWPPEPLLQLTEKDWVLRAQLERLLSDHPDGAPLAARLRSAAR